MIIAVASGKGGTGKTTVATSLALSIAEEGYLNLGPQLFLDCDVEEPNAALFLKPTLARSEEVGSRSPRWITPNAPTAGAAPRCAFGMPSLWLAAGCSSSPSCVTAAEAAP